MLVNLNPNASYTPSVKVSSEAITRARLPNDTSMIKLTDRLGGDASVQVTGNNLINVGVQLELAPASVRVLELSAVK